MTARLERSVNNVQRRMCGSLFLFLYIYFVYMRKVADYFISKPDFRISWNVSGNEATENRLNVQY
jgi:hypothetical protein